MEYIDRLINEQEASEENKHRVVEGMEVHGFAGIGIPPKIFEGKNRIQFNTDSIKLLVKCECK